MKVYYARPLSLYNTKQEERDLATLAALGLDVENPNKAIHQEGYKREGMNYFVNLTKQCDGLAFRAFADGSIPAGVAKEIAAAKEIGKPVIELPSAVLKRTLSVDGTRETLSDCGNR